MATLQDIRTKVRRLTRSPSTTQLLDADIDTYINTFVLYDFPEHLRLFSLRTNLKFYCTPNVDVYDTTTAVPTDPLYNFKNNYISVHDPVYIAGYQTIFSQSQEQFFSIYPKLNTLLDTGLRGDGVNNYFIGTLPTIPVLQNNVTFTSVDGAGNALILQDRPIVGTAGGNLVQPNGVFVDLFDVINYVTGVFGLVFTAPPANGATIWAEVVPYIASMPRAVLFYDEKFTIRPIPDKAYPIEMEAYIRPTALLNGTDVPYMEQWWQYIAYGAAKKVFEDRMDMDSIQAIMPEFKTQELLVLRTTISQQTVERTATIYTEQTSLGQGGSGWGWGSGLY